MAETDNQTLGEMGKRWRGGGGLKERTDTRQKVCGEKERGKVVRKRERAIDKYERRETGETDETE